MIETVWNYCFSLPANSGQPHFTDIYSLHIYIIINKKVEILYSILAAGSWPQNMKSNGFYFLMQKHLFLLWPKLNPSAYAVL